MCIIYLVLLVYVDIGLARWILVCGHTFELVRGRRWLKRAGGPVLPVRRYCSTKLENLVRVLQY